MTSHNSQAGKPNNKQPSKLEAIQAMEEVAATLHGENIQLKRIIWLLAMRMGGEVILNQADIDALWRLAFTAADPADQNMLKIVAMRTVELTAEQLTAIATDLIGTDTELHAYADAKELLTPYPRSYLEHALMPYMRWHFESRHWVTVEQWNALSKAGDN